MAKVDAFRVAAKVEWEGGVIEAFDWYAADDIGDPKLSALWGEAQAHWRLLQPMIDRIESYLENVTEAAGHAHHRHLVGVLRASPQGDE